MPLSLLTSLHKPEVMKATDVFDRLDNVLGNHAEGVASAEDVVKCAKAVNDYLMEHPHPDDCFPDDDTTQVMVDGAPRWYRADCGVCNQGWSAEMGPDADALKCGTFCPDCRKAGRMAPGVLNWELDHRHSTRTPMSPDNSATPDADPPPPVDTP